MKENHEPLLRDLLETDDLVQVRNRSLKRMLVSARTRRRRRQLTWTCLGLLIPVIWGAIHLLTRSPLAPVSIAGSVPPAPHAVISRDKAPAKVNFISTEELLALFPGRPLALVGPAGRQELVFLDEPLASQ
jgi:hypothetical protein